MTETPKQGPVVPFVRKPRQIRPQFLTLMNDLRRWREEDHEDNFVLYRSAIIELIEGVDALTEALAAKPTIGDRPED